MPAQSINPLDGISNYGTSLPSRSTSRAKSAKSYLSQIQPAYNNKLVEKPNGELVLPKTYLTRKGALLLFTAPDTVDIEPDSKVEENGENREMFDVTQNELNRKFGNLARFAQSVLTYGDDVSVLY